MRLAIAAVGRLKDKGESHLAQRYCERIDAAGRGVALGPLRSIELSESRAATAQARQDDESERLLGSVATADCRVALDETGRGMTSVAFAGWLTRMRDDGIREVAFLVGGPDGHGAALRTSADLVVSLSAMTLPHGLARVFLLEQIYRAITITAGHPYHRA